MGNFSKCVFVIAMGFVSLLTAGEEERKAAHALLDATQFEKMLDEAMQACIEMFKEMDPSMNNHEDTLRKFYKKHMSAENLREDVVEIYSEVFTVQELEDIAAFYKTKTGQKALTKLPEIMQRSMEMAQGRAMQHMGELQEMLSEQSMPNDNFGS